MTVSERRNGIRGQMRGMSGWRAHGQILSSLNAMHCRCSQRRDYISRITALRAVHPSSGISLSLLSCLRLCRSSCDENSTRSFPESDSTRRTHDTSVAATRRLVIVHQVSKTSRHAAHFCIHSLTHVAHFSNPSLSSARLITGTIVSIPRIHLCAAYRLSR